MTESNPCRRELLARSETASVERCACGTVHLTIGPLTLRLPPSAVESLASTLHESARVLRAHEPAHEPAERQLATLLGASQRRGQS
jgi:hypothetical protein